MKFDSLRGRVGQIVSLCLCFSFIISPLTALADVDDGTASYVRESAAAGRVVDPSSGSYTGAYTYQLPLKLPPGRAGMTPDLSLTYSSQSHSNDDIFGYGWQISIPYIERFNKSGLSDMYSASSTTFYSSLSGELVAASVSSGGGGMMGALMSPSGLASSYSAPEGTIATSDTGDIPSAQSEGEQVIVDEWIPPLNDVFGVSATSSSTNAPATIAATPPSTTTELDTAEPTTSQSTLLASPAAPLPADAPQLKLKASVGNLLGSKEYADGTVKYAYKTATSVDAVPVGTETLKTARGSGLTITGEVLSERTPHARTFATNKKDVYVAEIISGDPQYYRDDHGSWWLVDYGTTTKDSYDYQTIAKQNGILKSLVNFFIGQTAHADTSTLYPDPNPEAATFDGYTYGPGFPGDVSFSTIRSNDTPQFTSDTAATAFDGVQTDGWIRKNSTGKYDYLARTYFLFNTATIPYYASVTSATFSISSNGTATTPSVNLNITGVKTASNTGVSSSDHALANFGSTKFVDATTSTASWAAGYHDFVLNSSGIAAITLTGITKFSLRTTNDIDNTDPGFATNGNAKAGIYFADQSGTSNDPKLVVVYSAPTPVQYEARNDDGSNLTYTFSNNSWTVKDKSGRTYLFGTSTAGRRDDPNNASTTYKWMLQQVTDANGNSITYSYSKDIGQIYPASITYTNTATTTGVFSVDFSKSLRATSTATTTATGFGVKTRYKIDQIAAKFNGSIVHKYDLAYATGDNNSRLLLSSITETGQTEGASTTLSLQPTTFSYAKSTSGTATTSWSVPTYDVFASENRDRGVNVIDVNGDGLADLVQAHRVYDSGTGTYFIYESVYTNTGSGWTLDSGWTVPCDATWYPNTSNALKDGGGRIVDVNGDGLPDFICDTSVYLNTGHTWTLSTTWAVPVAMESTGYDYGVRFGDVNGDGLVDLIQSYDNINGITGTHTYTQAVYLNNGHGWTYAPTWTLPTTDIVFANSNHNAASSLVVDVNGDNLSDLVAGSSVYINQGTGWATDTAWTLPLNSSLGYVRMADINGDGLVDIMDADGLIAAYPSPPNFSWNRNSVWLNTGSGFVRDYSRSVPAPFRVNGEDAGARFADLNGDGIADLIIDGGGSVGNSWGFNNQYMSQGDQPDLLKITVEPTGRVITAAYKETPQYRDISGNLQNPLMAIALNTLQSLKYDDGLATSTIETYQYTGGQLFFANPFDRRLAGFSSILKTDAAGNVFASYFHQGNTTASTSGEYQDDQSKIGKIYRTENNSGSTTLESVVINKWDMFNRGGLANFVELASTTELDYDGNSSHRDIAAEYTYSTTTGDLLRKISWGEVTGQNDGSFTDTGSDKRTTDITYAASSTGTISLPSDVTLSDQSGTKISETRNYYDNLSLGSILAGNLTKMERWKSGSSYASSTQGFNVYGLVSSATDARGKTTTFTYDPYNLFPATTTNPLGQTTAVWYDYSSGKVKQTKDANNLISQTVFDPLDRPTAELRPDPVATSTLATTTAYAYTDTGMPRSVRKTSFLNSATSTDLYMYLDGFGRTVETRTTAEGSNTYAVSDSQYDNRGLLKSVSLPFFSSSTGYTATSSPVAAALLTQYTYDPLQRVLTIANSAGTTTNAYDDWKVTTTDANGHVKDLIKDAYGNLANVVEHVSTTTLATTTYGYNGNNNLITLTDALGNVRNFSYDGLGRRLSAQDLHFATDTSSGSTTYAYDDANNLVQQIDAKNQTVNYTYDNLNRPLTEDYTGQAGTEITYSYDWCPLGIGKLCSVVSSGASTTNEYNSLGLVSKETKTISSSTYATTYSYDQLGNQTLLTLPDSSQVKYTYNNAGQLEKVSNMQSGASSFSDIVSDFDYGPTGKVTYKAFGNGVQTWNTYDANHLYRLTNILTLAPSGGGGMMGMVIGGGGVGGSLGVADLSPHFASLPRDSIDALMPFDSASGDLASSTSPDESSTASSSTSTTTSPDVVLEGATTTDSLGTTTESATAASSTALISPLQALIATSTPVSTSTPSEASSTPQSAAQPATTTLESEYKSNDTIRHQYALTGSSLARTDGDTNVMLGDQNAPSFVPKATFTKFGDASLSISLPSADMGHDAPVNFAGDKVVWGTSTKQVRFYEAPPTSELPDGGYEIDVVLAGKPASNVVSFDLASTNLDFFYQPALNQEIVGTSTEQCTATECVDGSGNVTESRPENVVGSYAAYYKNGKTGDLSRSGGRNYKTGKAFHIYRPKITDNAGNSTWGDLNIDQASGKLTITIPQAFLDSAVYPITVDPTFGYSTIGASSGSTANAAGSVFTMPENGTITQISEYTKAVSGTISVAAAVYSDNAGAPNALLTSNTTTPSQGTTAGWVNVPVTNYTAATGTAYWLWGWATSTRTIYWDTGATNQYNVQGLTWPTWPNPITPGTYFARKISIYATYTASSSDNAPTAPTSLQTDSLTNPTNLSDSAPKFSAIYQDPDTGDLATSYQIQVSTTSAFTSTYWDSNKTTLASSTPVGMRIANVTYGGSALASSTTYYWRLKFWDNSNVAGAWSTTTSTFSLASSTSGTTTSSFVPVIQNIYFTYDNVGNITQINDQSGTGAGKNLVLGYDALNRLTSASTTAASSTPFSQTYLYDLLGNLTNKSDKGAYIYASTNYANPDAPTSVAGVTQSYDNNGNLTSDGTWSDSWDYRNRMTQSGNGSATSTYAYDFTGERVKLVAGALTTLYPNKFFNAALGSATTSQIFANGELIATIQTTATSSGSGSSTSTPAYVQGNFDSSTGNPVVLPNPVTSGDLIVVGLTDYNQTIPSNAISDNKGNTYTKIAEAISGTDHAALFYAKNVTGGSLFTASSSVSGSLSVQEYSGVSTSSPLDQFTSGTGSSNTPSSGNITTTTGNELYFGLAWSNGNGDSWTPGYNYSLRQQETNNATRERFATEDKVVSTSTTTPAYFTTTTSAGWAAVIATFKPSVTTSSSTTGGTAVHYVHTDQLSGSNAITDANANLEESTDFYPFGSSRIDLKNTSFNEPRKFAGTIRDDSTGLDYASARYYKNTQGQFISEDPVHLSIGDAGRIQQITGKSQQAFLADPQQLNSYSYAGNNPISKSDPTGNQVAEVLADAPEWGPTALAGITAVTASAVILARNTGQVIWKGVRQIPSPSDLGIPSPGDFNPMNWNPNKVPKWMIWVGASGIILDRASSIIDDFKNLNEGAEDFNSTPVQPTRSSGQNPRLYYTSQSAAQLRSTTITNPNRAAAQMSSQLISPLQLKLDQLSAALSQLKQTLSK